MPDPSDRYAQAGVHLDILDALKTRIVTLTRKTRRPEVLSRDGAFGGLFAIGSLEIPDPVLVSSMDGVGTKIKIACLSGNHAGIGADIVNHSINDILTCGAQPLFFMDYLASGRVDPHVIAQVIESLANACAESGMALLGGETAEMPDMYAEGEYDLAGCIVGVVSRHRIIDGQGIRSGDKILGLASNGLHTNGYSLVRRIFLNELQWSLDRQVEEFQSTLAGELLRPHRSYLAEITRLLRSNLVQGLAHITGGGFYGNLPRILPDGCGARIDAKAWEPLPVFRTIQTLGQVRSEEMYRVFNMGMGFLVVVHPEEAQPAMEEVPELLPVGEIISGEGVVVEGI
ncbi:MAG TPA: phosphoribosylformylglycinamidine cyclo-ligase [bacterium]|nr:phosphoribosylformylglycinamidine cyclo-ligase [bacterium]HQO35570.1 phosphoribosylformylglycinamidine cyclo-ligase [bacterium]